MPQLPIEGRSRISLRITTEEKVLLLRAAVFKHSDLKDFVVGSAMDVARSVIDQTERLRLSERDSLRAFDLLKTPPGPNAKLLAAASALPKQF